MVGRAAALVAAGALMVGLAGCAQQPDDQPAEPAEPAVIDVTGEVWPADVDSDRYALVTLRTPDGRVVECVKYEVHNNASLSCDWENAQGEDGATGAP